MLLLVLSCAIVSVQALTVRGTVVDQVNEPVIGATVKVLGTTMGAVTDFDGNFEIANVPDGATLKFTFMGMQAVEMTASEMMNVQMFDDVRNLDEVVVRSLRVKNCSQCPRHRPWQPCRARWPALTW